MPPGTDAKRAANKASYARTKAQREATLLRLDKGDLARFDAACAAAGLSRSAFAKLYLLPAAEAMTSRLAAIEKRRLADRVSLATFLARAVDRQLAVSPDAPPDLIAEEFDSLFFSEEGRC